MQAFVKGRPDILAVARKLGEGEKGVPSPKRRRGQEGVMEEEDGPRKRTRSGGRKPTSQTVMIVDSEDDIDEYMPGQYKYYISLGIY